VAPDLHFLFDFSSSNASFLVTDEGVLVVDARQHVRDGEDLIARIRKVTDKPIKWLVNTHFHGDHYLGNPAFKAAGATIVAHRDTAMLMQKMHGKEIARRGGFFKRRGYDPQDTKLVVPDVTFDSEMTIRLGGREIRLVYLGPGIAPCTRRVRSRAAAGPIRCSRPRSKAGSRCCARLPPSTWMPSCPRMATLPSAPTSKSCRLSWRSSTPR
jgi:hypothetical protein